MRGKLGESLASVQKFATPLERATTSSLEALQAYSLGQAEHQRFRDEEAIPRLQRAVELDPNFAMAWATLGVCYGNTNQNKLMLEALRRAFDLKDRASEHEKLYISAHHYDEDTGELEKVIEIYEQWKQLYPRDTLPWDNLALRYWSIGQYEKALANASEAMRLDPKDTFAYQNLAGAYQALNRYDEAKAIIDRGIANKLDPRSTRITRYQLAFLRGDQPAMQQVISETSGTLEEPLMLFHKARGDFALGKVRTGREGFNRAVRLAQQHGLTEFSGTAQGVRAVLEAQLGYLSEARQATSEALALTQDRDTKSIVIVPLVLTGDTSRAQKFIDDLSRESPNNTLLNKCWLSMSRALIELERNQPTKALAELESAEPYEFGSGGGGGGNGWPAYTRGDAYLKARDGAKALVEYRKVLDHRGVDLLNMLYPLARLGSARAYALQGDTAHARAAYQDFFAMCKDADPDIPILTQAKTEYAKLQ